MYRTNFARPLTAIQGFAETLLGGALDDPANRRRFVEIIREHSMRLARLDRRPAEALSHRGRAS